MMIQRRFVIRVLSPCLAIMVLFACSARGTPTPDLDLTATAYQATQIHLCCTATPPSTPTPSPAPNSSQIVLFRGNPQRTGVYDVPAIRNQPEAKWQIKVTDAWLMPPLVADGILYTGSGDGVLYALNAGTG